MNLGLLKNFTACSWFVLWLVVLFYIFGRLAWLISTPLTQTTNYDELREVWLHSQYNLNQGYEFEGNMVDRHLYTFTALSYIRGIDLLEINWETPPLGKYLVGWGFLITGNIMAAQWIFILVMMVLIVGLGLKIGLKQVWVIVPLSVLVTDGLFSEYARYVHMEFFLASFSMGGLWLFLRKKKKWWHFLLLGALVGGMMTTKMFAVGVAFGTYAAIVEIWKSGIRKDQFRQTIIGFGWLVLGVLVVFLSSYYQLLVRHGVFELLKLQWRILRLYRGYLPDYPWFEIWRILLVGRWRTWFADPLVQPVKTYWWVWPLSLVLVGISGFFKIKKFWDIKRIKGKNSDQNFLVILGWVIVYLGFSSIHVVFPNYLLTILPLLYILGTKGLVEILMLLTKYFDTRNKFFERFCAK